MNPRITTLQDLDTLKKGFARLRDKYTKSKATVSALENELEAAQAESEKLKSTFQEELNVRTEAIQRQAASTNSAFREVRADVPGRSLQ